MKKPAQSMLVHEGVVYRCKHVSIDGKWLFFEADGIKKLDASVMWCFTAVNARPIKPYFWYADDETFIAEHMTAHAEV